ncbi:sigma factor [Glycomyces sp. NPDC047010]|uniref:sigma factor n=1 Tax=Glycomyces sp. NPDC047010 TaxID=3155023 RepID=UPI0033F06E6A
MAPRQPDHDPMLGRDGDPIRAALFARLSALADGDPERGPIRDRLITGHLPLAAHIAKCYAGRDSEAELLRSACTGLIEAVDRFDPAEDDFLTFAILSMTDAVRCHRREATRPQDAPSRADRGDARPAPVSRAMEATLAELDRRLLAAPVSGSLRTSHAGPRARTDQP